MSALYNQVRDGACDLKTAGELANITGKYPERHGVIRPGLPVAPAAPVQT